MKKTGLGRDPLSWITQTMPEKDKRKTIEKRAESISDNRGKTRKEKLPKFQTFEVRLTSLLREDQLDFLEKLIRDIQKNRTREYRKERITKNTLIRVFIDAFMDSKIDISNIPDEDVLLERVKNKLHYP
ncbi:MAG TPA: hypothetical protein PKN36_11345 [bacterium]|nr:hypothetical protein [bacterium]